MKPYRNLTADERRGRWAKEFGDGLENFVGSITADQRALIVGYAPSYEPDDGAWLEYRQRWQDELLALVRKRLSYVEFELAFRDMAVNRERWYGAEYQRIVDANEVLFRNVTVAVLNGLDATQRAELSQKLRGYARDFDELVAEAAAAPPPAVCLVTC